ncbi:MAG: 2-oxoacid:acceptor oxidoreductase subunit alpha [Candidatus Kapabacteria bacterium]|jgi:2-oxoglutarate ferredoxin oxidoreductase subunit alpha|nr:2-oxoacid:acceptor oxidoreductase subunit alpha [Candidatus Kapabacteria bacterium]
MKPTYDIDHAVIRFAGDSGDGIQIIGSQFAAASALTGNDIRSLPDFPAEIRAPEGSVGGVSSFQIQFGAAPIYTAGDACNALIAMNAAALKASLSSVAKGGAIVANTAGFSEKNLRLAGYVQNPLEDGSLAGYSVFAVDITKMTALALADYKTKLSSSEIERAKNFFALGMIYWLYHRPIESTAEWIRNKFSGKADILNANTEALFSGWDYAVNAELFTVRYHINAAPLPKGRYRSLTGNVAIALGLTAAAQKARLPLLFAGYPITPASDILHTLSSYKRFGVKVIQAEDEIAAIAATLGASFGGNLAATASSGPGMSLKIEALGLGVMAELPLVVVDVQRAGPSTGMPTKTEQSDLLQSLYGRHGEAPLPVLAAASAADCFDVAFEASRIALKYMTPVIVLSDSYLSNSSEPWRIPEDGELPSIEPHFSKGAPEHGALKQGDFKPYLRDPATLTRQWAIPGTKALEHRIGGLEKLANVGTVSHDAENHAEMVRVRAEKIAGIANDIPLAEAFGAETGQTLVISWGSTFGAVRTAVEQMLLQREHIAHLHLRYLNPFPRNLHNIMQKFDRIVCVELNSGQLSQVLRGAFGEEIIPLTKITGQPFKTDEIKSFIRETLAHQTGVDDVRFVLEGLVPS